MNGFADGIDINTYVAIGIQFINAKNKTYANDTTGFIDIMTFARLNLAKEIANRHPEFTSMYQRMVDDVNQSITHDIFQKLWSDEMIAFSDYPSLKTDASFAILNANQIAFITSGSQDETFRRAAEITMIELEELLKGLPSSELSYAAHAVLCCALWFSDYKDYQAAFHKEMVTRQNGSSAHQQVSNSGGKTVFVSNNQNNNVSDEPLTDLLNELDNMTGLRSVKEEIHKRVREIRVKQAEEAAGVHLNNIGISLHMVFEGNPGTGKTTVARIVGKIYRALGILNGDAFVECDRGDLVVGYIGHTAPKVKEKVTEAFGGILFIDEAYSLYHKDDERDFGNEAIDTLVKCAEDYRDRVAIILAGYTDQMEEMIKNANPGLASRFNTKIIFDDYTPEELVEIFHYMIHEAGISLEERANDAARQLIYDRCRENNFGNARGVRNVFKEVYDARNTRMHKMISQGVQPTRSGFITITLEDILACDKTGLIKASGQSPNCFSPKTNTSKEGTSKANLEASVQNGIATNEPRQQGLKAKELTLDDIYNLILEERNRL